MVVLDFRTLGPSILINPPEMFWSASPREPVLSAEEVHVWRIELDRPGEVVRRFEGVLGPDEVRRADRFRTETLRVRYVIGRGSLRAILGLYLGAEPGRLSFRYGEHGKPALAEAGAGLSFNVSHSHGLALIAVALGRELGIDIERVRPMDNLERFVGRFFSARERAEFLTLPEDQWLDAFFRGWTCKEAYMKATGKGFALPLDRFDVSLSPEEPARLLAVSGHPGEPDRWTFLDLDPGPGHRAALAVEGSGWRCRGFLPDPAIGNGPSQIGTSEATP